jgi:hypothetical protein
MAEQMTEADLMPDGRYILEHWRAYRPNVVRQLEAEGQLYQHVQDIADEAAARAEALWKQGVPGPEATLQADRELIFLPDDDPTDEDQD